MNEVVETNSAYEPNILILDMQPIDPPVGGGRIRLLGLYHNLREKESLYIGTYDWDGEPFRNHSLTNSLRELDVPLSRRHLNAAAELQRAAKGKNVIDTSFPLIGHLSPDYEYYVRSHMQKADVIVFSHPWVFPLVSDAITEKQYIVYDSHNFEVGLRKSLLDDHGGIGSAVADAVQQSECDLCKRADTILVCSIEDEISFIEQYQVPSYKFRLVPNGVFTEKIKPVSPSEKEVIKNQLGINDRAAIFIGSDYQPNQEAAKFILDYLSPKLPGIQFIIAGGVGEKLRSAFPTPKNVLVTGYINEEQKLNYFKAADIAINPMFSGSGTNIKMFDFMASGLPVVSTAIGARGITDLTRAGIIVCSLEEFSEEINSLAIDKERIVRLGESNRKLVEISYSYEKISPELGKLLVKAWVEKRKEGISTRKQNRIAMFSPWNVKCGIAEYTHNLVREIEKKLSSMAFVVNDNQDSTSFNIIEDMDRQKILGWHYDYQKWVNSSVETEKIVNEMLRSQLTHLNIQYHPGFFSQEQLFKLMKACLNNDISVSVTLHNSRDLNFDQLSAFETLYSEKITYVVHTSEEKDLLVRVGLGKVVYIPLGLLEFEDEDKHTVKNELSIKSDFVIGSFGFLRPHKGVLEALEAINILRKEIPDIYFLGLNALSETPDSEGYFRKCFDYISSHKLEHNVKLLTEFKDIGQVMHYLHACDLVLLPYHPSNEGASASATSALSSKRPLVISKSKIFKDICDVCHVLENINPNTIALELSELHANPAKLNQLAETSVKYASEHSFEQVAEKYIQLFDTPNKDDF